MIFRVLALLTAVLLGWLAAPAWAQDVQPVPPLTGRVMDRTGTLSPEQIAAIAMRAAAIEQAKGSQVVVLMVPTTAPEDIASYANRVANAWKIGRREVGDGVLLIVALNDRRVRIEVAKTLEGAVPDLAAKRIIDGAIQPAFKRGDYAGGLTAAVDQLGARIKGEDLPPVQAPEASGAGEAPGGLGLMEALMILFIAVPLVGSVLKSMFGRVLGSLLTGAGAGALGFMLTSAVAVAALTGALGFVLSLFWGLGLGSGGRSVGRGRSGGYFPPMGGGGWSGGGGFGGGGGGGGFSSGGGGDFGGGGASGDW